MMEKEYYIKKWLEGTLTEAERKEFERTDEYRSLERLSRATLELEAPEYDEKKELERFLARRPVKGKNVTMRRLRPYLQMAAAVVLLITGYLYFTGDTKVITETLAAEKKEMLLPDSSRVVLNALSQVSYDKKLWGESRNVTLKGEAFFEVKKGSTFDVQTSFGVISVLGTAFNVASRDNYFEVICYEGLVQVKSGNELARLSPGHSFQIIDGEMVSKKLSLGEMPEWIRGESAFNSVAFYHVIDEFKRQYDVTVTLRNVDQQQLFTGAFVHDDISLALRSITIPLNLTFEIKENELVVLSGNVE